MIRYIIIDTTGAHWPGLLPYRGRGSRGYATWQEAQDRLLRVTAHYAARHGAQGGPSLCVEEVCDGRMP